ncbi:MAG: chromosome segregation protein SMC [Thermodesulfobacteriota bacterium]
MKIEKLSIQGFKSFMDRVEILISPGISAFVGPNGCGKSNIIDAIRWVMGEQSPKQLRGRQMEDMIFSGSGPLKALGMVEVALTLGDTEELYGTNEISICRRLYRSGESEYLINNATCRLKDIHDLFIGTGLGNRSYAIIAQGEIGLIIEQRPEEIRFLLEEAAGITKYKVRREESLRKVALTKENLKRVEDLLVEIKREMSSLKRQAGKARKFKKINSEINRLKLVLHANRYGELQTEKEKRGRIIEDLLDKKNGLEANFSKFEESIETKNLAIIEKEKSLSALKESVFSLREERRNSEDTLRHLSADQERFSNTSVKLHAEKEEASKKSIQFQSEIKKINSRINELTKSIQESSSLYTKYDSAFKEEKESLNRLKDELKQEKPRLIKLAANEASLRGEINNLTEIINKLETRKNELKANSGKIAKHIEKPSHLLKEKKESRQKAVLQVSSIEKDKQEQEIKLKMLTEARRQRESECSVAELECNLFRSQLKNIRDLIENYEGYQSGVQSIMNSYGQKNIKEGTILGVLADFIQVEPEFELAVEAVLAERLQYIIVARQEDGRDAVEYLRSKSMGRSHFLPIEEFQQEHMLTNSKGKLNGFKLLKDHITVETKIRPLVESFLGNAALTDNLSQALLAWNNGKGKQTLVTPEGDLVDNRGVIIGGRLGKGAVGLLTRRRNEKELSVKIKDKEKSISKLQSDIGELNAQLDGIHILVDQLENDKSSYSHQVEVMDRDIFMLENEAKELMKQSQYIENELELLNKERKERRAHLVYIKEELSKCSKEKERCQHIAAHKEAHIEELGNAIDDSKENLSQLLLRYNQYKEEERGLAREKERLGQFISEMKVRIGKLGEEINSNSTQYDECLIKEQEIKEALTVICQRESGLKKEVDDCEKEFEILREALREEEKKAALSRESISKIREEINEARIREAEIDFKLRNILSQADKEMGINLQRDYRQYLDEKFSEAEYERKLKDYVAVKDRIGEVNLLAINEYEKLEERYKFIMGQQQDLLSSIDSLSKAIRRINRISKEKFLATFSQVDEKLKKVFPILFNGGKARLRLVDESLPLESGVLVEVQPPGKRLVYMRLLSGGEKALAAMALLFAIYLIKPSPFIIMDEVDAPLDEANTDRFNALLREIEKSSQVIMVTHNRKTMEMAARLYGVTMDKGSTSKIVSVDLQEYR